MRDKSCLEGFCTVIASLKRKNPSVGQKETGAVGGALELGLIGGLRVKRDQCRQIVRIMGLKKFCLKPTVGHAGPVMRVATHRWK